MKVSGIIAEYNPFHKGHQWQISQLRRSGVTHIAVVMGGNFLQRGDAALAEKHLRAQMALQGGADRVIELPLPYACAGAQRFAFGGVALLDALGCVDELCFGSECGDMPLLRQAARAVDNPGVKLCQSRLLADGFTFAKARQLAVEESVSPALAKLLSQPNNILGLEYLRQIDEQGSSLLPVTLPRQGAEHDAGQATGDFASASFIRTLIRHEEWEQAARYLTDHSAALLRRALQDGAVPASLSRLETAVLARLRTMPLEEYASLPDLSEGLENRLYEAVRSARSLSHLLELCKTKRYPLARLRRLVLAAFLGLDGQLCHTPPPYIRVLGFSSRGRELLGVMKSTARLPVSPSLVRLTETGQTAAVFAALEAKSTDLYALSLPQAGPCGLDYTTPVAAMKS